MSVLHLATKIKEKEPKISIWVKMNKAVHVCSEKRFLQAQKGNQEANQKHDGSNPSCDEMISSLHFHTAFSKVNAVAQGLPTDVGSGDCVDYYGKAIML